ncbi:MAG: GGDEF domain-containing protein [Thermodesulfobacteriota bacterium]
MRRREYRAVAILLVFGVAIWVFETFLGYFLLFSGSYVAHPQPDISYYVFFMRLVVVIPYVAYGLYLWKVMIDVGRAEKEREKLVEDLVEARDALKFQATHDGLTGLWNRTAVIEALAVELARAGRDPHPLAVIMADLDHFKSVNDRHGHLVGDAVLVEAARRILASVRPYDTVGRYGGEEILVVLPGCNGDAARTCAQRIRAAISDVPIQALQRSISVSVSLGIAATAHPWETDPDSIIQAADTALYQAKSAGRNCVVIATDADDRAVG